MKKLLLLLSLFAVQATSYLPGQGLVTLGTDTTSNGLYTHPTPYGSHYNNLRVQYLIMENELTSLGLLPGPITSLAFNVKQVNNCLPLPGFTIKLKHTTLTELTNVFDNVGLTSVHYTPLYTPQNGWNTHFFNNPFIWDGQSNVLVDVCFDLIQGTYTQNATVYHSVTPNRNTASYFRSTTNIACGTTMTATPSVNRANMQIAGVVSGCIPPNNLHITNLTTTTVVAGWYPSGNEEIWHLKHGSQGFNPNTGGTMIENLTTNSYLITGLLPFTSYDFYVKAVCNTEEVSNWSGPYTFTTYYESLPIPFSENFPASSFPELWTQTYEGGLTANLWIVNNSSFAGGEPYEMRSKWVTQIGLSRLITPLLDLSAASSATLEFKHYYDDWSPGCTLKIQSSADGITWVDEAFSFQSGYGNIGPATITVPITTLSPHTRIAWVMDGNHDGIDFWYIDNVHITQENTILVGDANCDESVNLLDVISMVNEILNQSPQPFCFDNADLNFDGVINLLDLIGTVNIILN